MQSYQQQGPRFSSDESSPRASGRSAASADLRRDPRQFLLPNVRMRRRDLPAGDCAQCTPGQHVDPQSIVHRLRRLGINLLGSRNTALRELGSEIPAPLVADMLGYSDHVTQKHTAEAAATWAAYASPTSQSTRTTAPRSPQPRDLTTQT